MIYAFADIEIDAAKQEVRRNKNPLRLPPRAVALLHLLAANSERLVSKAEIVEQVWDGRAISDSAISTSIKEIRKAIGDDGQRQEIIRTVHGLGFRCVADVRLVAPAELSTLAPAPAEVDGHAPNWQLSGKPTVCVLPLVNLTTGSHCDPIGDGLAAELISALSRHRLVSVTSRGSSFRFRQRDPDLEAISQMLKVRYCLSGVIESDDFEVTVTVELARTSDGVVIWSDRFSNNLERIHDIRQKVVAHVIAALEIHIPANETDRARLLAPERLDAWAEFHIGLQHLYRFNPHDVSIAQERFKKAVSLEPGFARAHAGLSFVAFQNAFMGYHSDKGLEIGQAVIHAERSLELDMLDPFGNYCMGRAKWMDRQLDEADSWLQRSLEISPNYAQAHYLRSLVHVMKGEGGPAREENNIAMALSPLDPLYYAMLATQAMTFINEQKFEEAAEWAERAVMSPGCHYLPVMVAAAAQELRGNHIRAKHWVEQVKSRRPDVTIERFFEAFPYQRNAGREFLTRAFSNAGFESGSEATKQVP